MPPLLASAPQGASLTVEAPAKLTLSLRVTGRRADGYHLLDMTVGFTELADRLTLTSPGRGGLTVSGPFATKIQRPGSGADNLVLRAADRLAEWAGRPLDVDFHLEKHIPVAAGLGGGSADAAACLAALARSWDLAPDRTALADLAAALGADVPVCLAGQTARVEGIGEVVTPLPFAAGALVLVNPGLALATPDVFRAFRAPFSPPNDDPLDPSTWRNDLTEAARGLAPAIGTVLEALSPLPGMRHAGMAGSGATCFALMTTHGDAEAGAAAIAAEHPDWWVRADRLRDRRPTQT